MICCNYIDNQIDVLICYDYRVLVDFIIYIDNQIDIFVGFIAS